MARRRTRVVEYQGAYRASVEPPGFDLTRTPESEAQVLTTEPVKGYWRNDGRFGRAVQIGSSADPIERNTVYPVTNVDGLPGPPCVRPLHFFRSDGEQPSVYNVSWLARVTYGAGGIQAPVLTFDWRNGAIVGIVADQIRVDTVAVSADDEQFTAPELPITLGVTVGGGGATNPAQPVTFTPEYDFVSNGEVASFNVPNYARRVTPTISGGGVVTDPALWEVEIRDSLAFSLLRLTLTNEIMVNGLILPNFASVVRITNVSAGVSRRVGVVFELGL